MDSMLISMEDYWMFRPVFNHSVSNHCGFQAMADAITSTRRILLGPDAQAVSGQDLLEMLFKDHGNNELVPTEGFQNYIDQQPIQSQQELRRSHTISDEHFRAILILLSQGEGTEPYRLGIIVRSGPDQEVAQIYTIDPPGSEGEPILWIVNDGFEDIAPADLGAINHWEALGTPLANSPHPDTAWFNNLRRVMDSVNDSKITMDDGAQSPHVESSANAGEGPSSAPTPPVRNGKRKASRDGADGEQSPKRHRTSSASPSVTAPRQTFPATPSPSDVLYTSLNDVADSQVNQYDPDALISGQIDPENDPLAVELENEMRRMFEDG
ncbi:hypothetical protein B0O99DRAFT_302663 [Bisporella sp. PMI_857]|nr:hypothetical protein B0O99DRAFT_302663 [Bisporella sp. PMI_857]